jgi:uncharacterized protein (DUF1697 family)
MPTWVSLLRAVNVSGHNRLPMAELRDCLAAAGFAQVRSYLQSGNVVSASGHRSAAAVAGAVHDAIAREFGLDLTVVVRSPAQLREVLDWNPFPEVSAVRPNRVFAMHLTGPPDPDRVAALLAEPVAPDQLAVRGHEVAICYAESMHASRIQGEWLSRRLGVAGTARNWRTLAALVDLSVG